MLASRATWLHGDENFGLLPIWVAGHGLLIFRPEPRGDRFLDVGECFLLVLPLRYTSGQGRAFDHKPTIFRLVELHMENHTDILPVKHDREVTKGWANRPIRAWRKPAARKNREKPAIRLTKAPPSPRRGKGTRKFQIKGRATRPTPQFKSNVGPPAEKGRAAVVQVVVNQRAEDRAAAGVLTEEDPNSFFA